MIFSRLTEQHFLGFYIFFVDGASKQVKPRRLLFLVSNMNLYDLVMPSYLSFTKMSFLQLSAPTIHYCPRALMWIGSTLGA